jgi:hypothetical protein
MILNWLTRAGQPRVAALGPSLPERGVPEPALGDIDVGFEGQILVGVPAGMKIEKCSKQASFTG